MAIVVKEQNIATAATDSPVLPKTKEILVARGRGKFEVFYRLLDREITVDQSGARVFSLPRQSAKPQI